MTPFIVAEMSANHLGSLQRALDIVEAAKDCGADAIKVQTWTPGRMCVSDYTLTSGPWAGKRLADLYEECWLPWEWHKPIFDKARKFGLIPFSAAFDHESVDFLETLGVDRHKCASFELTDIPLIRHMASKGKPVILSAGMAAKRELVEAARHCQDYLPLKCTSAYPAEIADANLSAMARWGRWGLSDHTLGSSVAVAATALGAEYIEKHLTLTREGPDAGFSMLPHEFAAMVKACREAAQAIGIPSFKPGRGESTDLRRSLYAIKDIKRGDRFEFNQNFATARPALGLPPSKADIINGKRAKTAIRAGTPLVEGCCDTC